MYENHFHHSVQPFKALQLELIRLEPFAVRGEGGGEKEISKKRRRKKPFEIMASFFLYFKELMNILYIFR